MKTKLTGFLTLLLALIVQTTFAQGLQTITGTVTTDDGMPLPGVSVIVKGTSRGVQTNFDGHYSIEAASGEELVFSYLGMTTEEYTVADINIIDVTLAPNAAQLEQVVVTGYGIERSKRTTTYATETVDAEALTVAAPSSAASALAGKVAGLQINVTSNGVNPSSQIILRGLRSISQSNEALIVIDGSVATQGAFDDLNPINIKSINLLKGATAAALYGSKAGNGAVIVVTKNGSTLEGDGFTVGLSSTTTFEEVSYMPDFQDGYGTGWQGVYVPVENTNWGPPFDGVVRQIGPTFADGTFQEVPYSVVEDNAKDFYETGVTTQNTAYFSGADDNSNFYLAIGDQETTGIVPRNSYSSNTFRLNASQELGDLTLSANTSFSRDERSIVGDDIGSQDRLLYWFILNVPRNIPLTSYKNWQTDLYASPNGYYNAYYQNPYWAIDTNRDMDKSTRLNGNIAASWDITPWLNWSSRLGINRATTMGKDWRAAQTYTDAYTRPSPVTSFVIDDDFQSLQYTAYSTLSATIDIIEDVSLKAILGATQFTSRSRSSSIRANNLSIPDFYDISNGTGEPVVDVDESINKTYGFFGDFTFGFRDYLFLHLAGRQDYTSTLPADNNSYFYPSIGVSAVLTDMIPTLEGDVLNYLKLTASNSTVYNDLDPFLTNEIYGVSGAFPYGTVNGFFLSGTTIDPNIQKEKLNTTELTASAGFFGNRLTLDAAVYRTITSNLITFTTPGPAAGADNYLTNIGELESKGMEVSLGARIFDTDNFGWNLNVNYSSTETVVNAIKPGLDEIQVAGTGEYGIYAQVGEVWPQLKATSYVRDPQGRVVVDAETGNPEIGGLKNMGSTLPDYIVGLTSMIRVSDFTLAATMDYRTGHVYYSVLGDIMEFTGRSLASVSSNRQDFVWPNSVIEITPPTETTPGVYEPNNNVAVTEGKQNFWTANYNAIKENYVKDATALKLREIALNYHLPDKYIDNTFLNKVTVGVVGRNLITWLPEENRFSDPEFQSLSGNGIGLSGFAQSPPTRNYGFSINVEF